MLREIINILLFLYGNNEKETTQKTNFCIDALFHQLNLLILPIEAGYPLFYFDTPISTSIIQIYQQISS